ncbi:MAG: RsmB/NOP family class I SAM-dependent RNA methyltransferase [Alphaproteobacteria bacterium]|nr:RsmB/NOP family class I SAM-dependent RNA methyltransferase [Alphaproteobacteria bacterium]
MQTSARYMAVLDLLKEIFEDAKPADNLINEYLRARKYIGSKDRRFITETVWKIIRNRMKLEFDINSKKPENLLLCFVKDENLDEIYDGSPYGLPKLTAVQHKKLAEINEAAYPLHIELETPLWLYEKIKDEKLLRALTTTACADFRINVASRDGVIETLKAEGYDFIKTPYSPLGIRSENRINLANCLAYKEGQIEVQDEASQLVSLLCDVKEDEKIVDYCCGAGGKALTLAYLLKNKGKIEAHDINWHRLEQIKPRLERLGVQNIEICREITDKDYDKFIIDAPCSGTGTWRRSPDAKFRLTPEKVKELNKIQENLLKTAFEHTKIGGKIIYITCSVLKDENEQIILNFLDKETHINLVNIKEIWNKKIKTEYPSQDEFMLRLSPYQTDCDGFFITILEKKE